MRRAFAGGARGAGGGGGRSLSTCRADRRHSNRLRNPVGIVSLPGVYLLEFRYYESRLAKAGFLLASSVWTGLGLLIPPMAAWFVQKRLERRHALALAAVAASLVLATAFVFIFALFSMIIFPVFWLVQ